MSTKSTIFYYLNFVNVKIEIACECLIFLVGHYIPKAFYTIDVNGAPSPAQPIHRLRRQAQGQGQGQGQPGFGFGAFPQQGFGFAPFPNIQPGAPGTQFSGVSSVQTVQSNRFGDEPVVTGHTQTFHSTGDKFTQTNTRFGADGKPQTQQTSGNH